MVVRSAAMTGTGAATVGCCCFSYCEIGGVAKVQKGAHGDDLVE